MERIYSGRVLHSSIPFVAPLAAFIILLAIRIGLALDLRWEYPLQVVIVSILVMLFSRPVIPWRFVRPLASIAIGVAVFVIWIGPDVIWPAYR